jgi:nucleoside-diphosphate-sugar epimerase
MASALIGHTGFVGGNLARQRGFDEFYRSTNIEEIAGRTFDLVVCSGAPAAKWKANQEPDADRLCLDRLWSSLESVSARKLILISTIDVYARPIGLDEDADVDPVRATAYGRHRHQLERRVADRFDSLIVRLPGLFGDGLKKNVIHDFLHKHDIEKIDSRAVYQFYSLDHLWDDIERALGGGLRVVNFATEPVSVREVARDGFGFHFANEVVSEPALYDFRTRHDRIFGGSAGYIYKKSQVLNDLQSFVSANAAAKRCA